MNLKPKSKFLWILEIRNIVGTILGVKEPMITSLQDVCEESSQTLS